MIYLILALILSSLALVFSFITLVFVITGGRKILNVFVTVKDKISEMSTNFAGLISHNNVDHDRFREAIKDHHERLNIHARRLNDLEKPRIINIQKKKPHVDDHGGN